MKSAAETVPRNKTRRSNLAIRIPTHNDVFPFAEGRTVDEETALFNLL
jgi:hypothetical protein